VANQDFSLEEWVEVDIPNRLTKTASRITFNGLTRQDISYIYKDFGEDYFSGSFGHDFTFEENATGSGDYAFIWLLGNSVGTGRDIVLTDEPLCYIRYALIYGTTRRLTLVEAFDAAEKTFDIVDISEDTPYYLRVVRDEGLGTYGTLYMYVYTDSDRTVLHDTAIITLKGAYDFRYLYMANSYNDEVGSVQFSGYVENLDVDVAGTPTVTTQTCTDIAETTATANGNITSLGLGAVTQHGVAYSFNVAIPALTNALYTEEGAAGATGAFTSSLTGLFRDAKYYIRAYATNAFGTSYGAVVTLYTDPSGVIQMAFGEAITTAAPDWTDVTVDIMSLQTKRGRMHDLDRVECGTAVIVAKNINGNWWRENTDGDYTPNMKPLTLIRISSVYNGTTYRLFYGLTESFKPGWVDRDGARVPVMTITCVDLFKSLNKKKLQGLPGTVGDYTDVVAITNDGASGNAGQKTVKIKSLGDSTTQGCDIKLLHAGQTVTLKDEDTPAGETHTIASIDEDTYTLTMVNDLTNSYTTAKNACIKKFPAALSSVRVTDVVYEMGWPIALTTIGTGVVTVQELVPPTGGIPAVEHLQDVAEAESGLVFMNGDGKLIFQNQTNRISSTSSATFGDDGVENLYYIPDLADDDTMIFNEARISGDAIDEQIYRDLTYQATQGERCLSRNDSVINTNAEAFDQAYVIVERNKDSFMRVDNLIILPDADPANLYPMVFGYEISTLITLELQVSPNTAMLSRDYHIEAIEHLKNAGQPWQTKWQLWNKNLYRIFIAEHTGYLYKSSLVSYADCRTAANGDNAYDDNAVIGIGQLNEGDAAWYCWRGFLQFDTSDIGAGQTISEAEIIFEVSGYFVIDNEFDITLVGAGAVTYPLEVGDYNTLYGQTTSYGTVTISTSAVNSKIIVITLNATGRAAISKTGTTYFGLRSSRDIAGTATSSNDNEILSLLGSDSALEPRLIVKLKDVV